MVKYDQANTDFTATIELAKLHKHGSTGSRLQEHFSCCRNILTQKQQMYCRFEGYPNLKSIFRQK